MTGRERQDPSTCLRHCSSWNSNVAMRGKTRDILLFLDKGPSRQAGLVVNP